MMMMHPGANSGAMLSSMTRSANGSASIQVVGGAAPAGGEPGESVIAVRPPHRADILVGHEQPASEQASRSNPPVLDRERFAGVEIRDQQAAGGAGDRCPDSIRLDRPQRSFFTVMERASRSAVTRSMKRSSPPPSSSTT